MRLCEALTAKQKAEYREKLQAALEIADRLDGDALKRAAKVTRELQRAILGRFEQERVRSVYTIDEELRWNPAYLPTLQHAVNDVNGAPTWCKASASRFGM